MINKKLLKPIQNKGATKPDTSAKAHDTLLNRDKAEQHPISAITDLQTTLDAKQAKLTAIDAKLVINTNNITKNADDILLKANETELVNKQDKLTAGANISIVGDVISSTGGAAGVTLDTAQTITGIKTFTNGINNNLIEVNGNALVMKNSVGNGSTYFKIEQVYNSGYKNWFGLSYIRTTGTTQENLAVMEVRQDDYLYIVSSVGLTLNSNSIELKGPVSINGATNITGRTTVKGILDMSNNHTTGFPTPIADSSAANKKYVDDAIAAALRPYLIDLEKRKES